MAIPILILASILAGEAGMLSDTAMIAVGHVALNRLDVGLGIDGFYGRAEPEPRHIQLVNALPDHPDPTGGAYFILSHQDVAYLTGQHATCIRSLASWKSDQRIGLDGTVYALYAYHQFPTLLNPYQCDERWKR